MIGIIVFSCGKDRNFNENLLVNEYPLMFEYQVSESMAKNIAENILLFEKPVSETLKGGRNTGWWIFGVYSDGHAWVCDGCLNYIDPCTYSIYYFT